MIIPDLIRPEEIKINSDSPSIISKSKTITYSELNSIVNKTALFLNEKGIKEDDIVALLFNNNSDFIITIFALWEIGAVPVPLNLKLTEKDLIEQIKFLKSNFTIKDKEFQNISTPGKSLIIPFGHLPEGNEEFRQSNFSNEKTALILFTSGSSGKPKAVMLSYDNLIQSSLIGNKVLNQTNEDKWLASLPFYHIGGFSIIFRAMMFGTSIIIPTSLSAEDLINTIKYTRPTLISLVSTQLKKFVDAGFTPPQGLRMILLGGGFSDNNLVLTAIKMGWKIAKVYGSTETSSFISFMNYEEVIKKPGTSGKTMPPNKITISNNGEILVQSPAIMTGYYNNEQETAEKIKNGLFHTGDFGYLDDDGYLYVEAKREDLIISGGENINPFEVEKIILTHPDISEVCITGIEDEKWGQVVCAVIVLKESKKLSENDLKNFLKAKLAAYKIPKKIIFINELPKSELGKVLKDEIKKLLT